MEIPIPKTIFDEEFNAMNNQINDDFLKHKTFIIFLFE
jgi:hypothetical protein